MNTRNITGFPPYLGRAAVVLPKLLLGGLGAALPMYLEAGWVHLLVYPLVAVVASPLFCVFAFLIHTATIFFPATFVFPVTFADAGCAVLALLWFMTIGLGRKYRVEQLPDVVLLRLIRPAFFCAYGVLLLWTLLRPTSLVQGLSLICIVALVHRANPALHVPIRSFLRGLAVNSAVLAVSVVCAILLLEGGARLVMGPPKGSNALWIPDQEYHFLLNPGAVATQTVPVSAKERKKVTYRVSSQGFRDREYADRMPEETRILLLGDSFTMGHAVDDENTIASKLASLCRQNEARRTTVINGGMNAAGPFQELGMLEKRGLALKPDCVVLQLFLPNDFDDCLMTVGKEQRCFVEMFHGIANNLRKATVFPEHQEYLLRLHSSVYNQIERATNSKPWASQFLSNWKFSPNAAPPYFRLSAEDSGHSFVLDVNRTDWYPELLEGADLIIEYIARMHALCSRRNIPFAVYSMPDYHEIDGTSWSLFVKWGHEPFTSKRYHAMTIIEGRLAEKGVVTFSVAEALEQEASSAGIEALYYTLDGHPTPRGNEVVAKRIHEFLVSTGRCE